MLAVSGELPPTAEDARWGYEFKWDGVRAVSGTCDGVLRLRARSGIDITPRYPELARLPAALAGRDAVLDGEVVALHGGEPARFQELQDRVHLRDEDEIRAHVASDPAALVAFDLLADGGGEWMDRPWTERRARLEERVAAGGVVRVSEVVPVPGAAALERARAAGGEGVIAKRAGAPYRPGPRSRDCLKLKGEFRP